MMSSPSTSPSSLSFLQSISPLASFPVPGPQVEKSSTLSSISNLESPDLKASVAFPISQGWNDSSRSLLHELGTTIVGTPIRNSIAQSTAMTLSVGANIGSPALRNDSKSAALVSFEGATVHVAPASAPDAKASTTASIVPISILQVSSSTGLSTTSERIQFTAADHGYPTHTPDVATYASPVIPTATLQAFHTTQDSLVSETSRPITTSQNALADVAAVFGAKFEQVASTLVPIPVAGADIPRPTITPAASVLDMSPAPAMMFQTLEGSEFHMVASMLEAKYATVSTEVLDG